MSKYIRLYNEATKHMRIVDLRYLKTIAVPKEFCREKKYMFGTYIYYLTFGTISSHPCHDRLTDDLADICEV